MGTRCTMVYSPDAGTLPAKQTLRVSNDCPLDTPVKNAELYVIEAFPGKQLRVILADPPERYLR